MSLLEDEVTSITISPFVDAENNYLPKPDNLNQSLLLVDRCYLNLSYFNKVIQNNGSFIVRGKHHINPLVKEAYINGKRLKKLESKKLKFGRIPKNAILDLMVEWKFLGGKMSTRLIINWSQTTKEYVYLVTNLARTEFLPEQILLAHKLRWQIELLFKEWKSYANLKKIDTSNPYIAEGLIWAALAASIIKRFIAHLAQAIKKTPISTRIVAMSISRKIIFLIEKLIARKRIEKFLLEIINYLTKNAKKTNLSRERKKGRGALGLSYTI